jgi:hypothetical protein
MACSQTYLDLLAADLDLWPVSRRCTDGSGGLLPDLCSSGVRAGLRLTEGAGGFLPGVPLGCCLGMGTGIMSKSPGPPDAALLCEGWGYVRGGNLTQQANASRGWSVPSRGMGNWARHLGEPRPFTMP